jgi:hypothetical protein
VGVPQLTFYSSNQRDPIVSIFATNGGGGMIFSGIEGTTKAISETTKDGAVLNLVDGDKGRAHSGMGSLRTTTCSTLGQQQIIQPACPSPLFPGHMQLAPETVDKLQKAAGFGFDDGFHHQLPAVIQDGDHNRFLVHVHSDIFA